MKVVLIASMLLAALLFGAWQLSDSSPADTTPTAVEAVINREAPFKIGRSCFSGIASSYDDWAAAMVKRSNGPGLDAFHARFSRDSYDNYKSDLDCHVISYPVGDLTIRGIYARPKDTGGRDLPVLIVNRGGNAGFGKWNFTRLFRRVLPLAHSGYIVIGSQYRGSRRDGDPAVYGSDEFGGADVDDVMALLNLVDQLPGADKNRMGMYGWSRGGFMALIAATRTDRLKAMAVGGTPTDLAAELLVRPEMERVFRARIPNYDSNKQAALEARSAVYWADELDADLPILILHGEQDDRVSLKSAQDLAEVLSTLQHPHKLVVYKDGSHGLIERNDEVIDELRRWFDTHLLTSDT